MLAHVLLFCREMRGYTKFELEALTGISVVTITQFEENETIPSTAELESLSKVFRVPTELMIKMAEAEICLKEDSDLNINIHDITLVEALFKAYMALKIRKEELGGDASGKGFLSFSN